MSVALFGRMRSSRLARAIRALFANGEPGFWLDPSDLSTMYQDSAGTTPVTVVEQPVGLILDKSKGLVLGAELLANGNFAAGSTGWGTNGSGIAFTGGVCTFTNASNTVGITQTVLMPYQTYCITYTVQSISSGSVIAYVGGNYSSAGSHAIAGTYSEIVVSASLGLFALTSQNASTNCVISGVSVKKLAGTHYYQFTAGVRPVLSARVNLLTKTEDLTVSPWGTNQLTVTTGLAAYNGTATAFGLIPSTSGGNTHYIGQSVSKAASNLAYTDTWFVKSAGYDVRILIDDATTGSASTGQGTSMDVNLTTGAIINPAATYGAGFSATSGSVVSLGSGWYAITLAVTSSTATSIRSAVYAYNGGVVFAGDGTKGVIAWHPDCRPSDQATGLIPTYQRVNTSTDYDTAGFPLYLSGNGTQWMQCASQDYTGVSKIMICGGIRKKSDAALAVVFELSPTIASNNGAVLLSAPNSAAANLNFSSKGTTQVDNVVTTYTSPNTTVLTGLGDISAPSNIVRVNGAQVGSVSTTQGTGNYGNYAGFLFARNGASSMLTGNIYGLVARGSTAASSAAQIAAVEAYENQKTRAF